MICLFHLKNSFTTKDLTLLVTYLRHRIANQLSYRYFWLTAVLSRKRGLTKLILEIKNPDHPFVRQVLTRVKGLLSIHSFRVVWSATNDHFIEIMKPIDLAGLKSDHKTNNYAEILVERFPRKEVG